MRICAWAATWQVILDRPPIGTDFGTFNEVFPRYRDPVCLGTVGVWQRAHNSYLEFLAGFGVGGVLGLALCSWFLLSRLQRGIKTRKSLKAFPICTLGAFGFVAAHSVFDFPLQIPGVAVYFAALMAVGCAISMAERGAGRNRAHGMADAYGRGASRI